MQGLAALLFPAVLMLFAMGMDKVQARIDRQVVSRDQVEDFLQEADSDDVDTLAAEGLPTALDEVRTRRVTRHEAAGQRTFGDKASPQRAS